MKHVILSGTEMEHRMITLVIRTEITRNLHGTIGVIWWYL